MSARRPTEPAIRCPLCLRGDPPSSASGFSEHAQADRAPGGQFVILEVVNAWTVTDEGPGGDCPVGKWQKIRCPRCKYEEIGAR